MKQIVADRRALHKIPELDRELDHTMAYLRQSLKSLRCKLFSPIPDSLCAYFDNGAQSTLAFRSGADALPVHERTFLPFSSEIAGQMHACGHDGHMAMLLELARRMDAQRRAKNILLIFQPAEETTGGARDICKSGVFEAYNVECVFGIHLWPDLPLGVIASRKREMMARSCEINVTIEGRSCSVACAENGVDALRAGLEFYRRLPCCAAETAPEKRFVLHFGRMESGCQCNVVSDFTCMEGTLRAFDDDVFFGILDTLNVIADTVAGEIGCKLRVETSMGYPSVVNAPELFDRVRAQVDFADLDAPVMVTEDFSWYQRHLPAMFFFLGTGPSPALQSETFNFNERALLIGADFLEKLTEI